MADHSPDFKWPLERRRPPPTVDIHSLKLTNLGTTHCMCSNLNRYIRRLHLALLSTGDQVCLTPFCKVPSRLIT